MSDYAGKMLLLNTTPSLVAFYTDQSSPSTKRYVFTPLSLTRVDLQSSEHEAAVGGLRLPTMQCGAGVVSAGSAALYTANWLIFQLPIT